MGLLQATAAAFGIFCILHFYVIPRLYRRLLKARAVNAYSLVAAALAAEVARGASLVVGLSLTIIVVGLRSLSAAIGYGSQQQLAHLFELLRQTREHIESISAWWGIAVIALLSIALWIALKSEAQRQSAKAINAAFEKLKADAEAGVVPDLPPTAEMAAVEAAMVSRKENIIQIIQAAEREGGDLTKADPEKNRELARLVEELEILKKQWFNLDVLRRLEIGASLAETNKLSDSPPVASSVFLSTGFFRLVSGTTRALTIASLALLAPALVAVSAPAISAATLQASVGVHNLILTNTLHEAEESWARSLQQAPQEHALSKDDEALINQLAQAFTDYANRQNNGASVAPQYLGQGVIRYAVRQQILRDFARTHSGPGLMHPPVEATASQLAIQESVLAAQANAGPAAESARKEFRDELTRQAKKATPGAWDAFRARALQAVQAARAPISSEQLVPRLLTEVLNSAGRTAGLAIEHSQAFSLLAENLFEPGELGKRGHQLLKLNQYRFLNGIMATGSINAPSESLVPGKSIPVHDPKVTKQLHQVATQLERKLNDVHSNWREHPPSLATPTPAGENLALAQKRMHDVLAKGVPARLEQTMPHALATYADYFPGALGEETRTARAGLMASAPRLREGVPSRPMEIKTNFVRARSYGALRGFARVGGVLIGLGPSEGDGPNIVDMQWTSREDGVRFALKRDDGNVLSFGPFRSEIIRLALAYAADGRPVTVTMPAAGEIGRKVLLHPALVDTALGCEARQLDQFADAFTARAVDRVNAEERVQRHFIAYSFAWAIRVKHLAGNLTGKVSQEIAQRIEKDAEFLLSNDRVRHGIEEALKSAAEWDNTELSPVTLKVDYFEQDLVKTTGRCLANTRDVDAFRQCIATSTVNQAYINSLRWAFSPPAFFSESGVRELSYRLDRDLTFLQLNNNSNPTWPFKFIVQVTFESPRYFAKNPEDTFDERPFEYPALQSWMDQQVAKGIATSRTADFDAPRIMLDLREFTVLQRFFRLAFDGKLGGSFPIEALLKLNEVKPRVASIPTRTPIWNYPELSSVWLRTNGLESLIEPLGISQDMQALASQAKGCPAIKP